MAKNEKTSGGVSKIAAQGLKNPSSLSNSQIRKVCGSALTQAPDKSKKR
jgi:hypothetical protein